MKWYEYIPCIMDAMGYILVFVGVWVLLGHFSEVFTCMAAIPTLIASVAGWECRGHPGGGKQVKSRQNCDLKHVCVCVCVCLTVVRTGFFSNIFWKTVGFMQFTSQIISVEKNLTAPMAKVVSDVEVSRLSRVADVRVVTSLPRMPVTTRIITFLVGNPGNLRTMKR